MVDTTSLFVHILGAAAMVGGGIAQYLLGRRLRTATDIAAIIELAGVTRTLGSVVVSGAVLSFLSGGHLAGAVWSTDARSGFAYPFITVGAVGLVVLAPLGLVISHTLLRRVVTVARSDQPESVSADVNAAVHSPMLWAGVHSVLGFALGMVTIMVYKPASWTLTAMIVLVGFIGGWAVGTVTAKAAPDQRRP